MAAPTQGPSQGVEEIRTVLPIARAAGIVDRAAPTVVLERTGLVVAVLRPPLLTVIHSYLPDRL